MISSESSAFSNNSHDCDFTLVHYRDLLKVAKSRWDFIGYKDIHFNNRFILWRHDIDLSLNRALVLARLEHDIGVKATYFINPHSEFYNFLELSQQKIIREILSLDHDLGLHFDATFHDVKDEADLDYLVGCEAQTLEDIFDIRPVAFSFHNPLAEHLAYEAEYYGGLLNCYSHRFKKGVAYCSDSNGYWRFRRLHNVLSESSDSCLQVLTHPGWWQDKPMPPRQRVFRSAFGRARAAMHFYDTSLEQHSRINHAGAAESLRFLKDFEPQLFELCDYLWNQDRFETLFIELWRFHESQISKICMVYLINACFGSKEEIDVLLKDEKLSVDGWFLFSSIFEENLESVVDVIEAEYMGWVKVRDQLIYGRFAVDISELEAGCVYLSQLIKKMSDLGVQLGVNYDAET